MTAVGEVVVPRPYYYCPACRAGHSPRDAALGLPGGDLTRGAAEAVALTGALGRFAEGAGRTLPKLAGLRVSESTVERATERAGERVGERLAAGEVFGPGRAWAWSRDADGKTCGYLSADLTGVGMQGPCGAAADGRMAAVGMVWIPGVVGHVRYVCGMTHWSGRVGRAPPPAGRPGGVGPGREVGLTHYEAVTA